MIEIFKSLGKELYGFGKSVISERDGSGSASRSLGLIVATGATGVLVAHFCVHHALPDPGQLYGLSALVGAGSGAYAANKIVGQNPPPQHLPPPSEPITPPEGGH